MGLRKLFEKASASKFLRDIYWALFDIRSKNMTDVLNCITLHWMYILAKTETIPGISVNLTVKVNSKYSFLCWINTLKNCIGSIQ